MPNLNIEMFDSPPKVGDKITVKGTVKSVDSESGKVEASYDDVSIDNGSEIETGKLSKEVMPEDQSLDSALSKAFPNTQ